MFIWEARREASGVFKGMQILFRGRERGEIDDPLGGFKLQLMRVFLLLCGMAGGWAMAQTGTDGSPTGLSDLPSADAKPNLPGLDEAAPAPDLSGVAPAESSSVPQLRPPVADPAKKKAADDSDWAAQATLQKQDAAKQKREEALLEEQKEKEEAPPSLAKEKKEKEKSSSSPGQPVLKQASVPGFGTAEAQKLPAVTGMEGVQPRGLASGDGRVQPSFDSFTGPADSGPLGKDFQSGAKPIMPNAGTTDGRIQVPPKAPEPPSGSYKKLSQDPYTLPAGYGEKKAPPPLPPKPVVIPPNPSTGDPKRVIDDTKAGYSPYDNTRKVPDPRSQRRF